MAREQLENTQGAPTEGLGQTVTFVGGREDNAAPQMNVGGANIGASGIRESGPGTGAVQIAGVRNPGPNPTMALLGKVADEVAASKLQQRQRESFLDGMQQAAQGKAIGDIVNEQPWYSKIFGDSDTVEGARAYTANARVAEHIGRMQAEMPKLRSMAPQEFSTYYNTQIQGTLTGDKPTDAAMMQSYMRHLPSFFTTQAKEHYGWQQTNAVGAMATNFQKTASLLQQQGVPNKDGFVNDTDMAQARKQFVLDNVPPIGIDENNFKKGTTAMLVEAAVNGQLHAVKAYRESGALDVLDPQQRAHVQSAVEAGEQRLRVRYSGAWNNDLIDVDLHARDLKEGESVNTVLGEVDKLNERYMRETGSATGLIGPGERAALAKQGYAGLLAERQRAAIANDAASRAADTAAGKAAALAEKNATIDAALNRGVGNSLVGLPGYSKEEVDARAGGMWNAAKTPQEKFGLMQRWFADKYVPGPVKNQTDGAVGQVIRATPKQFSGAINDQYAGWKALNDLDPNMASAYYPDYGPLMKRFDENIRAMGPKNAEQAWAAALTPGNKSGTTTKDERKFAVAAWTETSNKGNFGNFTPTTASMEHVSQLVQVRADKAVAEGYGDDKKGATLHAVNSLLGEGKLDQIGSQVMMKDPQQVGIAQYLNRAGVTGQAMPIPTETTGFRRQFDDYTMSELRKVTTNGVKPESVYYQRLGDQEGVPVFNIYALDSDGTALPPILTTAEHVRQYMLNQKARVVSPHPMRVPN